MFDEKLDALALGLDKLAQRMDSMSTAMLDMRREMGDMGQDLRLEMSEMGQDLRLEMSEMGQGLRQEMRTGFSEVSARFDKVERKIDGITTFLVASEKANEKLTDRVTRLERPKKNS